MQMLHRKHFIITFHPVQSIVLSGIYSAIPYILLASLIPSGGLVADLLRKVISTTIVRKIMTSTGKLNLLLYTTSV